MSFKSLGDSRRQAVLYPFLQAAGNLRGVCVTFAIHRTVESLFVESEVLNPKTAGFASPAHWTPKSFERVMRIVHLLSILLAGLSSPGQHILWITDNDDIVANLNHHQDTVNLLANVASHYLTHNLGRLRIATATSDAGDQQLEDLLSIPDLVAGSIAELLTHYDAMGGIPSQGLVVPLSRTLSKKTLVLSSWLSVQNRPLTTFVLQVSFNGDRSQWNLRILDFGTTLSVNSPSIL